MVDRFQENFIARSELGNQCRYFMLIPYAAALVTLSGLDHLYLEQRRGRLLERPIQLSGSLQGPGLDHLPGRLRRCKRRSIADRPNTLGLTRLAPPPRGFRLNKPHQQGSFSSTPPAASWDPGTGASQAWLGVAPVPRWVPASPPCRLLHRHSHSRNCSCIFSHWVKVVLFKSLCP